MKALAHLSRHALEEGEGLGELQGGIQVKKSAPGWPDGRELSDRDKVLVEGQQSFGTHHVRRARGSTHGTHN
ncbi:hypothetical protein RKD19_000413 [Streptomyces canus]